MTKISPKYDLIESKVYIADHGNTTTYGICTTNLKKNIFIKNISTNIEKTKYFINLCNTYSVSPLNLEDVLEDFIT